MRLSQGAVAALECFNEAIIHEVRFRPAMLPARTRAALEKCILDGMSPGWEGTGMMYRGLARAHGIPWMCVRKNRNWPWDVYMGGQPMDAWHFVEELIAIDKGTAAVLGEKLQYTPGHISLHRQFMLQVTKDLPRIRQLAKDMYAGAEEYQQQARTVIELLNSDRVIPIEVI